VIGLLRSKELKIRENGDVSQRAPTRLSAGIKASVGLGVGIILPDSITRQRLRNSIVVPKIYSYFPVVYNLLFG
jgi:hypothetical protein